MSETPAPAPGAIHTSEDEQILHKLGYAQELFRAMGGFQNFAISFTIISILAGCLTSYYIAFQRGGPVAVTWGWLIVGLMSTIVALSMAEIASAYPTAGGLYYWSSKLGSPAWGWFTGWFNLIGQIAVTAAIGYGLAIFAHVAAQPAGSTTRTTKEYIFLTLRDRDARSRVLLNMFDVADHVAAEHDLGLLAHGRRRHHRRRADHRPRQPPVGQLRLHARRSTTPGFSAARLASSIVFWYVFAIGLADVAVHDHRLRRLGAHGRGDAPGIADGRRRHGHGGRRLGHLRLHPARSRSRSRSRTRRARSSSRRHRHLHLDRVDEHRTGRRSCSSSAVVAQFFCLTASVTSASRMMFAFSRDRAVPGPQAVAAGRPAPRPAHRRDRDRRPRVAC